MASSDALRLYVAPNGSDAASGRAPAMKGADGPFATISRARDEIRKLKTAGKLGDGATVYVRGGVYPLQQTLSFDAQDSGTQTAPIVYRAYEDEHPRLVGGQPVNGFQLYKGKILQCDMKSTKLKGVHFLQLFFNGQRQVLARYPNADPADPHGGTWGHVADVSGNDNHTEFQYGPEFRNHWAHPEDGRVCIFPSWDWAWDILPINKIDTDARTITVARSTSYALKIGDRFFIENLMEELNAPGEWFLDPRTDTLYFWPPSDIMSNSVMAPALDTVLSVKGSAWLTFRGFTIEACDGTAAQITDSVHCKVAASTIRNCGGWGISVSGGEYSGAEGNDVTDCGEGGISVSGGDRTTLTPGHNFADNNYVHHCAVIVRTYRPGVSVNGVGNRVSHNLVHDMPHAGLLLGGNDNVVEYNIVHHVNLQSGDTGGIYFCSRDWTQRGNIIRYNIFHDIGGFGKTNSWQPVHDGKVEFDYPHFTWGIYLDDPTTGTTVYGNVLYRVPICGLHNHGGRDNTFENNIIVDCPAFQAGSLAPNWSEWPSIFAKLRKARYPGSPYLKEYPEIAKIADTNPDEMSGVRFLHNIVYYTVAGTQWLREQQEADWGMDTERLYTITLPSEDFAEDEWDYNTVYCQPPLKVQVQLTRKPNPYDKLTWSQWQKAGGDTHSVLADPQFVDIAKLDFRLKPDSPALKLGFKQIPVDKIGPYKDELRATWPIQEVDSVGDRAVPMKEYYEVPQYKPLPAVAFTPRSGAGNFFSKFAAKQPVKVAYFGGGIHPANGWRATMMKWLRAQYPGVKIDEISADITDACRGSAFSVYRFRRDVIDKHPDLVLVDFASDDAQSDTSSIYRAIEGVVRQAWSVDPHIDLCFLYAFRKGYETNYQDGLCPAPVSAYERLANYYKIPSINIGYSLWQQTAKDNLQWSANGVVPNATGDKAYAAAITDALAKLAADTTAQVHPLPKPYNKDNEENARLVPIDRSMLSGDWKQVPADAPAMRGNAKYFDVMWETEQPGAKLSFKFKGTACSILDLMGPATGQVKVTLDGKETGIRRQVDPWCYYYRLSALSVASGLPDAVHTVTFELLPTPPDRTVSINGAKTCPDFNAKEFEGVKLYFGSLQVLGDVVK